MAQMRASRPHAGASGGARPEENKTQRAVAECAVGVAAPGTPWVPCWSPRASPARRAHPIATAICRRSSHTRAGPNLGRRQQRPDGGRGGYGAHPVHRLVRHSACHRGLRNWRPPFSREISTAALQREEIPTGALLRHPARLRRREIPTRRRPRGRLRSLASAGGEVRRGGESRGMGASHKCGQRCRTAAIRRALRKRSRSGLGNPAAGRGGTSPRHPPPEACLPELVPPLERSLATSPRAHPARRSGGPGHHVGEGGAFRIPELRAAKSGNKRHPRGPDSGSVSWSPRLLPRS